MTYKEHNPTLDRMIWKNTGINGMEEVEVTILARGTKTTTIRNPFGYVQLVPTKDLEGIPQPEVAS